MKITIGEPSPMTLSTMVIGIASRSIGRQPSAHGIGLRLCRSTTRRGLSNRSRGSLARGNVSVGSAPSTFFPREFLGGDNFV